MNDGISPPSPRARIRRAPHKARYDRETVHAILDAQPLAHLGVVLDDGSPLVIPTLQWREGDHVYVHGSAASRALKAALARPVCLTVALLDAWKLARSAFHHSVNYRSVIIHGRMETVAGEDKRRKLDNMIDTFFPGRSAILRPMKAKELKATTVLRIGLEEAVAKVDDLPVQDDAEDLALPIWAGVVPQRTVAGEPRPDADLPPDVPVPEHVVPAHLRAAPRGEGGEGGNGRRKRD